MKKHYLVIILLSILSINCLMAKKTLVDTLNITAEEELTIQIISNDIHKQKETLQWKHLINDFQYELKNVSAEIPAYHPYKIDFIKNKKITAEQLEEKEDAIKYKIKRGDIYPIKNQSVAILNQADGKLQIKIYFEEIAHVVAKDYVSMVAEALNKLEERPKLYLGSSDPADKYQYLYDSQFLIKEREQRSFKPHFVFFVDGSIGTFPKSAISIDKSFIALNYGVGISFGNKEKNKFFVTGSNTIYEQRESGSFIGSINEDDRKRAKSFYWGGMYKPNRWWSIGMEQISSVSSLGIQQGRRRYNLSIYPIKRGKVTYRYYPNRPPFDLGVGDFYSIEIGYGF